MKEKELNKETSSHKEEWNFRVELKSRVPFDRGGKE